MPSPASAGGSGANGTVFTPPNQGAAAGAFGDILAPLAGISGNAGAGTPGAWAYPQAQGYVPQSYDLVQQFLTGFPGSTPSVFDQSMNRGIDSAITASDLYGQGFGGIYNSIPGLTAGAGAGLQYAPQLIGQAFNPMYGQAVDAAANNPFYPQALSGAQQGASLGAGGANSLYGAGQGILQQGFDPQGALFGRSQQQLLDQSNAVNAMSGVAGSPYGAGLTSRALGDFDLNWQNGLLSRMQGAAGAASPLFQAAPGMAYNAGQMPSQAYMGHIGDILKALQAQGAAGVQGAQGLGSLLSGAGAGLGQAQNLLGSTTGGLATSGMLPYQTGATIANNAVTGLGNQQGLLTGATELGNNQYLLPMQVLNQLQNYLTGGRNASQLSANIGQQGFNQTSQGFGGLLSGANMLFNPMSGFFPGAMGGLTKLFGF